MITIMKHVVCSVLCPPGKQMVGVQHYFTRSARETVPPPSKPWRRPVLTTFLAPTKNLWQSCNKLVNTKNVLNILKRELDFWLSFAPY